MKNVFVLALALVGCVRADQGGADKGPGTPPPQPPKPAALDVSVKLASASLADDCGPRTGDFAQPPPAGASAVPAPAEPVAEEAASSARMKKPGGSFAAQDCARGDCGHLGGCQQTTLQLTIGSGAVGAVTEVKLEKVELLDEQGAVVGELAPRDPKLWKDNAYVKWAGSVGPNETLNVSYDLSAPDWSKLGGSRMAAQGRTFKLRVTAKVGDRAVSDVLVSPVIAMEPHVVT